MTLLWNPNSDTLASTTKLIKYILFYQYWQRVNLLQGLKGICASKEACCAAKITGNCAVNAAWRSGEGWQLYNMCMQVLRVEF